MEERILILKMLQEGKITAEEADKLLEAIGDSNKSSDEANQKKIEINLDEKVQKLQQKASEAAEKLSSSLNANAKKFTSNSEKFGEDFAKKMESFGNDIADSAVKFSDKLVNYLGNLKDVGFERYNYEKKLVYQIEENTNLSIDTNNFSVIMNSTSGNELLMNLYINSNKQNLKIDEYITIDQASDSLSLETEFPSKTSGKIEVYIPKHLSNLDIDTSNGKCEINNISADSFVANTSNGKICFINCQSNSIEADTSNGKITAVNATADDVQFDTSNGGIEINNCRFDELNAETSNGSILLNGIHKINSADGNYSLDTSNGKIIIGIDRNEELGYMIDASTSLGSISTNVSQLNFFVDKIDSRMSPEAKIKSSNFDTAEHKIYINASTSNSSILIEEAK